MRWSPHPITLRQLQYILAVAETRSFRGAAERCHVSQPSLSTQIAQAERVLGVRLFERDRRHVLVTPAGEEMVRRARNVLVPADELLDACARFADPFVGALRIGVIPTVAPYLLPEIAPALRRALPKLELVWTEDRTAPLMASLHAGALDAALVALEADLGDVEQAEIGRDPFVVAVGPQHPWARSERPLRPEDLEGVDLLLLADGHCLRDQALTVCGKVAGAPFGATSLATLSQMVASGKSATLLPSLSLPVENRRNQLHVRRFTRPVPGRTLVVVWRKGAPVAPVCRKLSDIARTATKMPG
jgi:LysR family hydrogen peroxide-inducible transcriptional activator